MIDNDINQILWEKNKWSPYFDLETIEIPKTNFDPRTPIDIIKKDLHDFWDFFTIGHINARSLNKNINELKVIIEQAGFDAVSVSESWLRSRTPKDRFHIDGYKIFRTDRRNKLGGGV